MIHLEGLMGVIVILIITIKAKYPLLGSDFNEVDGFSHDQTDD